MIFEIAALVGIAGIILFALGFWFERPELAMFGALLVIGIGIAGMYSGYQIESGEIRTTITDDQTNETVTTIDKTYKEIEIHPDYPLDIIVLLLGAVMLIGSAGAASETDLREKNTRYSNKRK